VNFWNTLPVGFTVLAPMEDVTDTVFRRLIGLWGAPDVFMSEFINSTELVHSKRRFAKQHAYLDSKELADLQRPLVAQIWGNEPEDYRQAIPRLLEAGFVGIDINMGCPAVKVVRRGSCAGLIDHPAQAGELIQAAQEACAVAPVSVKTRLGVKEKKTHEWAGFLLSRNLAALTIHGRIAAQMSEGEADWDEIASVVRLRDELGSTTRIIGNGDLRSREDLARRQKQSGVDGLMVGRGIFYDPQSWPGRHCPAWTCCPLPYSWDTSCGTLGCRAADPGPGPMFVRRGAISPDRRTLTGRRQRTIPAQLLSADWYQALASSSSHRPGAAHANGLRGRSWSGPASGTARKVQVLPVALARQ
jgi:tRNA-dihydrouridine synthase